ncbi:MAG: hypothetical protein RLZZ515_405, partial [Cyanobacteriota bacterium]
MSRTLSILGAVDELLAPAFQLQPEH